MSFSSDLYPVASLIDLMDIQGGAQPPAKTFKDTPEGGYVRFVQIRDFETDAHLTYIQALPKWRYCTERDVLIARYGASVGRVCRGVAGAYNVALAKVIPKDADLDFLYHLLRTRFFQDPLAAMSGRSAQAGFNKSDLAAIKVPHPPLDDQKKIVSTLNCLDDRIELLRKTNSTLESIAQALFKSWFVYFDPVRAKKEGRQPEGMDEATAALFPDSFEESELGLIPTGWTIGTMGDSLAPKRGKSITKSKCIEGDIPVVAGGLEPAYFHNQGNVSSPVVTISASGANAGFVRLYQQEIWASDCSFVSREQTDMLYFWYVFLKYNQEKIYFMQQGAAQPHVYPSDLARLLICTPKTNELQKTFNGLVSSMFDQIGLANSKINTLSNLRDTLLPRLISGQLRLPEAEQTFNH